MILAVESSGTVASVALVENGGIIAQSSQNKGLTHSRTLMPMIEDMMRNCDVRMENLTGFAVSAGPGSFTGLRIGMAAVKGMATVLDLPCVAVSSLEAQAFGLTFLDGAICVVSDAHFAGRFYHAIFSVDNNGFSRISPDEVLSPQEISQRLAEINKQIYLIGDGAAQCYNILNNKVVQLVEKTWILPCAASIGLLGEKLFEQGQAVSAERLRPIYLTLPQAERERLERLEKQRMQEENK